MASIPNLNTLRTQRGGPRRRRGARNGSHNDGNTTPGLEDDQAKDQRDAVVQETDGDASSSRMSAVTLGYLEDDFAKMFFPPGQEIPKRYPIINRGTYVRSTAIDHLVMRFLKAKSPSRKQIISLGAGSDTRFFRLFSHLSGSDSPEVDYHELDFEENVNRKRAAIRNNPMLSEFVSNAQRKGWVYRLNALDLRDLIQKSPPTIPGLEHDLPTLLLSECCLCYLPPDSASSVVQYFTMHIKESIALVLYEPIRPFDSFGKTMVSNLASRGIHLQTLERYATLGSQRQRLNLAGFTQGQGARDVYQLWESDEWISSSERDRVEKLEWLDEVEEWKLLASHYCVTWGWRGDIFGEAWSGIDGSWTVAEQKDDDFS